MKERSLEDDLKMIHIAHASRYHWGVVGGPLQFERGEWQISRVYSVLDRSEPTLYHAKKCLALCKENDIGDFDLSFAYEAMARAYRLSGEEDKHNQYYEEAEKAGKLIKDKGNREYFFSELKTA